MRRMSAIGTLWCLAFVAATAVAQSPSPAPVEPRAPAVATPSPQATEPAAMPARAHDDADARACLEFVSNVGVIRCAEKFRHASARPAH